MHMKSHFLSMKHQFYTLLASLLTLSPLESYAEHWQPVSGVERFLTVEVDMDSIRPSTYEDMVFFSMRADDHDNQLSTKSVLASCSEYSMETEQEQIYHIAEQQTERLAWKQDGTLKHDSRYANARLSFWGYTQAHGQAIQLACRHIASKAQKRLEAFDQENCVLSNPLYKIACAPYASWRTNYKLYMGRSHDAMLSCGISEQRMTEQTAALLRNVMRCKNETCGNQILENWIRRRGKDIASVIHLQKEAIPLIDQESPLCSSIRDADEEIARYNSEEMYAKAVYFGCLKRESASAIKPNEDSTPDNRAHSAQVQKACAPHYQYWQNILSEKAALLEQERMPDTDGDSLVFSTRADNVE